MFPALQVKLSGMLSSSKYVVLLDFVPADQFRYKFEYESTSWMVACEEGTPTPTQIYTHPFSPQFGFEWCRAEMSFIKCKLTNNYRENCGHVSTLISSFPVLDYLNSPLWLDKRKIFVARDIWLWPSLVLKLRVWNNLSSSLTQSLY